MNQAEALRKLVDRCGIERSTGDKSHLVVRQSSDIHSAEEEAAAIEHNAAEGIVRPGRIADRVIVAMLRQFPAVVDEEQMAIDQSRSTAYPCIDHEAAGNAVIGGLVVSQLNGVCGGRAGDGMGHMHSEGLIFRTQRPRVELSSEVAAIGCELAGEDIRCNRRQSDEKHHWRQAHEQVGDDEPIAHLPQHMVDQPSVEDDEGKNQPYRNSDEDRQRIRECRALQVGSATG